MNVITGLPEAVAVEIMCGVDDVLRKWLNDRVGLEIWRGGQGDWLVLDKQKSDEGFTTEADLYHSYSYADCLKWCLAKVDEG